MNDEQQSRYGAGRAIKEVARQQQARREDEARGAAPAGAGRDPFAERIAEGLREQTEAVDKAAAGESAGIAHATRASLDPAPKPGADPTPDAAKAPGDGKTPV
ncbi:hypothetical protein OG2516_06257 [Oceanicola granulosus HTCC2516]|uniref:Uncharacterized protein n=1 Tax=Oceanicola granulosus (strain ATCC BAA-861 / DSM 15982 / KCTC 12143 / HTCC2516) TaxID=314256 RepID=Q2CDB3_OCEGH|nr:hypothetical protein [Oceanicola granulosus]EAR50677.1 hypothetical protein OG2516_06257 [Oceanicola granulosus HTCC2516]